MQNIFDFANKGNNNQSKINEMTEKIHKFLDDNPWARWSALVLLASAMFFGYIFVDILSPLESELPTSALGWSATDYGNYTGAETFLNVFVFFYPIVGMIVSKYVVLWLKLKYKITNFFTAKPII